MAPAIKEAEDSKLVAVLSRNRTRADSFAEEYGIDRAYDKLEELLGNPEVDVVYIASPNGLHATQTIRVAAAGKHVFCEKPMAPTPEACRSMIEECNRYGVKLGLALQYRQHPAHLKMREIVASGKIGQAVFTNAQVEILTTKMPGWYYEPGMAGGGAMYLVGVHRLDLLRFIIGCEVLEVSAFIGEHTPERPFEEMVAAILRFANGAYGALHFSLNIPHGANTMEVHGSQASMSAIDTTSLWWGGGGGEVRLKGDAVTATYQFQKPDLYRAEVEDFNRCIREDGEPLATGMDGLIAAEICAAMFESGRLGTKIRIGKMRDADQVII
jgi:predicted dehydrogenase